MDRITQLLKKESPLSSLSKGGVLSSDETDVTVVVSRHLTDDFRIRSEDGEHLALVQEFNLFLGEVGETKS